MPSCNSTTILEKTLQAHTRQLPVGVVDVDVHGAVGGMVDDANVLACVFLCLEHTLDLPVCPVEVILKDGDGKDVLHVFGRCV